MKHFVWTVSVMVVLAMGAVAQPAPVGEWSFDDTANPFAASIGSDLELSGTYIPVRGLDASDGAVSLNATSYFIARHGIAANGGGDFVNQYSMVMDIKLPVSGVGVELYNTNATASNASEGEITADGFLGNRFDTGSNVVESGVWHRVVIAADLAAGEILYYLNGNLEHTSPGFSLDGGFALWTATAETPWLTLLYAAEDSANPLHVTYAAVYDSVLSADDAAALAGPDGLDGPQQGLPPIELPDPTGVWDFPADNPLAATVGEDLELSGEHEIVPGVDENDGAAAIFPGSYYIARHNLDPNGGGGFVNLYSVVVDVKISQLGQPYALYNSNAGNGNAAEAEITPEGFLGNRFDTGETIVEPGLWHRIVISADLVDGSIAYYLNGALVHTSLEFTVDGGFALWSVFDETPWLTLFSDVDSEDSTIFVTRAAVYGEALTAEQASALAGPLGLGGPVAGLPIVTDPPETPSITSVTEAPSGIEDVVIVASEFSTPVEATHLSSTWQVALDESFATIYLEDNSQSQLTAYTVPNFRLPFDTTMYARVQYSNSNGFSSAFSEPVSFTLSPPPGYVLLFEETFDSTENLGLPEGWSELSFTDDPGSGEGLDTFNPQFSTWITLDQAGLSEMPSYPHSESLFDSALPLIDGSAVVANSGDFASVGTLIWESHLFSPTIDGSNYTDIIVTFNSHYIQNQDNIALLEYTVDGATVISDSGLTGRTGDGTWLPIAYHLDSRDVVFLEDGSIDGIMTWDFLNFADGTPYAYVDYALAAGSQSEEELLALVPHTYPVIEESINGTDGLRYNRYLMSEADNQPAIQLRWMYQGTWSWYWVIDNVQVWGFSETPVDDWTLYE